MISRSLRLVWRHALRFKSYSIIKTIGLALGFASSIAILHFVSGEFSYDKFHRLPDNVYRVNTITQTSTGPQIQAAASPMLAPTLMAEIPEVEAASRLRHADDVIVEINNEKFNETKVFFADSNFFKVMTFPLVKGNPNTALKEINTAVITTELAERYFGNEDPINKTIKVNDEVIEIRAVTHIPGKSHFDFNLLISFETFTAPKGAPVSLTSWAWTSFPTYVRLRESNDASSVERKFPSLISKYRSAEDGKKVSYQLQPIKDVYLHSRNIHERDGIATKGNYSYTIGLAGIAVLIMFIACFNFANISTALSLHRIKEAGIKRTLGTSRSQLFFQTILESILYAGVSLLLALIILKVSTTKLENLLNMDWQLTLTAHLKSLPLYVILILGVGFIGGLSPAIFLSRLKPQLALKAKHAFHQGKGNISFKGAVIVFQFLITAVLVSASLCIKRQIDFIQSKDLGYNKEGIITIHVPDQDMRRLYSSLRNKFSDNPAVLGVSASRDLFDGQQATAEAVEVGNSEDVHTVNLFRMYPNFVETMGIDVAMGKTFTEPFNDSSSFILNEAAVKMFGWDKDVLGRKLRCYFQTGQVIGVVKDFHFSSLHTQIEPLILLVPKTKIEYLYVRINGADVNKTLAFLESGFKAIAPHLPFEYHILDDHIDQLYRQDQRLSQLTLLFCALSVFLACLGLYGVISLITEGRTKEIGIRKVLGGSVARITILLSREFMLLVLLASMLALPISYYLLEQWLEDYAYRIDLPTDILLLSVIICMILAAFAVSFRSIKAASANPVDSIKME